MDGEGMQAKTRQPKPVKRIGVAGDFPAGSRLTLSCMQGKFQRSEMNSMKINTLALILVAISLSSISSCVPLAVGAAAGYVAHDEGYRVQSPITKPGD